MGKPVVPFFFAADCLRIGKKEMTTFAPPKMK
jgi:hypothetical protein